MEPRYRDAIHNASAELSHALLEDIPALLAQGLRLDALVRDLLRAVGLAWLSALYQGLCAHLVQQATDRGLSVQSRPRVRFNTLILIEAPSSAYHRGMLSLENNHSHEEETSCASTPNSTNFIVVSTCTLVPCTSVF